MTPQRRNELALQLFGPNVTEETVRQAGDAMHGLLRELTRVWCGDPDAIEWRIGPAQFICDGCDLERPTAELPPGWITDDLLDYCPRCVTLRESP